MKYAALLSVLLMPFWIFNNEDTHLIQKALQVELCTTDAIQRAEVNDLFKQVFKKVEECNYEKALQMIIEGLQQFPTSFELQADFATLIGDLSEKYESPLKERMIEKSKAVFNKLLNEVERQSERKKYRFRNEYYYRFAMHVEQYQNGIEMVNRYWNTPEWKTQDGYSGYYYQGVGATYKAKQLMRENNIPLAHKYAHKALVAWAQYFSHKNTYYNAFVHYALALGILGYKQEMIRALEQSENLINKDLTYFEFKDVIDFVESMSL